MSGIETALDELRKAATHLERASANLRPLSDDDEIYQAYVLVPITDVKMVITLLMHIQRKGT